MLSHTIFLHTPGSDIFCTYVVIQSLLAQNDILAVGIQCRGS